MYAIGCLFFFVFLLKVNMVQGQQDGSLRRRRKLVCSTRDRHSAQLMLIALMIGWKHGKGHTMAWIFGALCYWGPPFCNSETVAW